MRNTAERSTGTAPARRFALFATAIGDCGVAWQGDELTNVLLPAADGAAPRSLLRHLSGGEDATDAPWPPFVRRAVDGMQALLRGEAAALAGVPLAWTRVSGFERRVYEATQRIGPGATRTYGELARELGGGASDARAVGTALGRNPWPLVAYLKALRVYKPDAGCISKK